MAQTELGPPGGCGALWGVLMSEVPGSGQPKVPQGCSAAFHPLQWLLEAGRGPQGCPLRAHLLSLGLQQAFWCLVQICEKYLPGYYSEKLVSKGLMVLSAVAGTCKVLHLG